MAEKTKTDKPSILGKKTKKKEEVVTLEREYVIPLRIKWQRVVRYKRANKAIKAIKEFLVRHMKIRDRDLKKIKIDKYLNEAIWFRGIKKPPIKIKVKAIKQGEIVRVELADMPQKLLFKKAKEEKRETKALSAVEKKKKVQPVEEKKEETVEEGKKKEDEKEKTKAGEEIEKQIGKAAAKQTKHQTGGKTKQPKRQMRKALAK